MLRPSLEPVNQVPDHGSNGREIRLDSLTAAGFDLLMSASRPVEARVHIPGYVKEIMAYIDQDTDWFSVALETANDAPPLVMVVGRGDIDLHARAHEQYGCAPAFVGLVQADTLVWQTAAGVPLLESPVLRLLVASLEWHEDFRIAIGSDVAAHLGSLLVRTGFWWGGAQHLCGPLSIAVSSSSDVDSIVQKRDTGVVVGSWVRAYFAPGLDALQLETYQRLRFDGLDADSARQAVALIAA